jgi:tRNA (mo5U34)-methyltransferase
MDIRDLAAGAAQFRDRLTAIKGANHSADFEWYPYNTFGAFPVLASMLGEERRDLRALAGAAPVLDIGCGDGDLSFFLESVGCQVTAIENPHTNFNRTLGFRTLRTALGSRAELEIADLDSGFDLRGRTFGLAFCLGLLYHLKNPFAFLEKLARHARYCVLSTRIAQVTLRGTRIEHEPIAYLVSPSETNNDATNYWIFSEAGLRRLLDRCGWDVCDWATSGTQRGSDPASADRDQRAFCKLRSKLADPWLDADLDGGWHEMENASWRWTERNFAVRLTGCASAAPILRFQFTLPEAPRRLRATVNGVRLPECEYESAGQHTYTQPIPAPASSGEPLCVRFELDRAVSARGGDCRELGVQVVFWSYEGSVPRQLSPIAAS